MVVQVCKNDICYNNQCLFLYLYLSSYTAVQILYYLIEKFFGTTIALEISQYKSQVTTIAEQNSLFVKQGVISFHIIFKTII
jgi:hypothetical protein